MYSIDKKLFIFLTSLNFGSTLLTYLDLGNLQAHFTFLFIPYPTIAGESGILSNSL